MFKGIITDFHGLFVHHATAESYCKEYNCRHIQWFKKKFKKNLVLILPCFPSIFTNTNTEFYGHIVKGNKLFIKMALFIILKKYILIYK